MNFKTPFFLALILLVICNTGCTDSKDSEPSSDVQTEERPSQTSSKGEEVYAICSPCHGDMGQGIKALNAPAIANQENWYLKRQLHNFKNGLRGSLEDDAIGAQMAAIAKTLDEQKIDLVVDYIKSFPSVKTEKTLDGNIENGSKHYSMICGACHGAKAVGNESLNSPRLTGVDDWYLDSQFNKFKNGLRGFHKDDTYGAQMKAISNSLPDAQTSLDVVAYIQSLQE